MEDFNRMMFQRVHLRAAARRGPSIVDRWRERGVFKRTPTGPGGRELYTFMELVRAAAIGDLVDVGLAPRRAADVADLVLSDFYTPENLAGRTLIYHRDEELSRPDAPAVAFSIVTKRELAVERDRHRVLVTLDLGAVVAFVRAQLQILDEERAAAQAARPRVPAPKRAGGKK